MNRSTRYPNLIPGARHQAGITVPALGVSDKLATVQLIRTGTPVSMQAHNPETRIPKIRNPDLAIPKLHRDNVLP